MVEIKNFKVTINPASSLIQLNGQVDPIVPLASIKIKSKDERNSLSVSQFAREAQITPQAVRKMISERRLEAVKLGEQYVIRREELVRYLQAK